jgi:hypothetical protein
MILHYNDLSGSNNSIYVDFCCFLILFPVMIQIQFLEKVENLVRIDLMKGNSGGFDAKSFGYDLRVFRHFSAAFFAIAGTNQADAVG